jgi:hypothetical protein
MCHFDGVIFPPPPPPPPNNFRVSNTYMYSTLNVFCVYKLAG